MDYSKKLVPFNYAWINLTAACNNRCVYCYNAGNNDSDIEISVFLRIIELLRDLNLHDVILIGGEPTMHREFLELLGICSSNGIRPLIVTNGSRFADRDFCKQVVQVGIRGTLFSVLAANANDHDSMTKRKGSFEEITKGIGNLNRLENAGTVQAITTITSSNINQLRKLIDLSIEWGLSEKIFNLCTPSLECYNLETSLSPRKYAEIIEDLYTYAKSRDFRVVFATNVPKCVFSETLAEELVKENVIRTSPCMMYRTYGLQFLSDGSVTPCPHLFNEILGNPFRQP